MIPLKVTVENFLCYGTPAASFDFDKHPLWILSGANGTGKSALFDAITYALFGQFRGSDRQSNKAEELIHHDAKWLRVEFEFEYGGVDYRVTRRYKSGSATVSVSERRDRSAGDVGWAPREDVNGVTQLKEWVRGDLGLSFDTFVCSILLRQGKAEEIIDADPKVRLRILHGIIDIERYRALHTAVAQRATDWERDRKRLATQLDGMPEVAEATLLAARQRGEEAQREFDGARQGVATLRDLLGHSRTWEALQQQLEGVRRELRAAAERDDRRSEIEQRAARLRELRDVVPALAAISGHRAAAVTRTEEVARLRRELEAATGRATGLAAAVEQERQKARSHRDAVAEADRLIPELDAQLRGVDDRIKQAEAAAAVVREVVALEQAIGEFPATLSDDCSVAEAQLADARAARDALPHLETIAEAKADYRGAADAVTAARGVEAAERGEVSRLTGESQTADTECCRTERVQRDAEREQAAAEARLSDARAKLVRFRTVAGGPVCSECGQTIDPEHATAEVEKLGRAVATAESAHIACTETVRTAVDLHTACCNALVTVQGLLREAEHRREAASRAESEAGRRQRNAASAFQRAEHKLSPPYRAQLAGIDGVGFPTEADLTGAAGFSARVDNLAIGVRQLQEDVRRRERLQIQHREKQNSLAHLGSHPAPESLADERAQLDEKLRRLRECRTDHQAAVAGAEGEERRLAGDLANVNASVNRLTGSLATATAAHASATERATAERDDLPTAWWHEADTLTASRLASLTQERDELQRSGVEQQDAALVRDRELRAERERQEADLESRIAQLPEGALRSAAEVEREAREAERVEAERDAARTAAARDLDDLVRRAAERERVAHELDEAGKRSDLHKRLAELLGKKGLQLTLVRGAEAEIVELANDTLSRISNGHLRLDRPPLPEDDDGEAVFDLTVRQAGRPHPIGLAFLSGSQRFRVAVSLALAVGRYASKHASALEAVIIDEGFGCLDRDGRDGMIAELQRLQRPGDLPTPLKRIILVSHHEDFADAFPVGYRLNNSGGVTTAVRFG